MVTVVLAIGLIGLFFVGMSVRLFLIKDGQFKGTCASQSPFLNKEGTACSYCGRLPGEQCKNPDSEVNKVMDKFK